MSLKKDNIFDMIIIGGGATGAGIALDASSRGYKVLLLEKNDFASGTSSKSSKLIHGGVRYLEKAISHLDKDQYNLVKEALLERATFLRNAPHLTKKLKLDTPIYSKLEIIYMYIGLFIYRLISGNKSIGENSFMNKTLTALLQPEIKKENLEGAISFFDGKFIDSRMVIALLQTAKYYNAQVKNYSEVTEFIYDKNKKIKALRYKDILTDEIYEVKSSCIINATGVSIDLVRKLDDKNSEGILDLSSGIHIVLDKKFLPSDEGLLIPKTSDGRVVFVLPYFDKCLVGTTDNKTVYEENPKASDEDIEYLIDQVNNYFDLKVEKKDILSTFSGIRPLLKNDSSVTEQIVREHQIFTSNSGLVTIAGGKWTTYRKMAEELVDFVIENNYVEKLKRCKTKTLKVIGSKYNLRKSLEEIQRFHINDSTKESLFKLYGNNAIDVIETAYVYNAFDLLHKDLPYIKAEVIYSIKHEFVKKPIDFLARRICICFIDKQKAIECVDVVCEIFKVQFLWSNEKLRQMKLETKRLIKESF